MGTVILLIVALGAMGAFVVGGGLLVLYFRANRAGEYYEDEAVVYGNLIQCPHCGYMNPFDAAACLNCRAALHHGPQTVPPPEAAAPRYVYSAPTPPPQNYGYVPAPQPASAGLTVRAASSIPAPVPAPALAPIPRANGNSPMPNVWLEGISGPVEGQRVVLTQSDTLIGRSTQCDVQVYDPKVSRRHFLIRYGNGRFYVQDQNSSRGTRVNGEKVSAGQLNDGDRIEVGDTCLIFHAE